MARDRRGGSRDVRLFAGLRILALAATGIAASACQAGGVTPSNDAAPVSADASGEVAPTGDAGPADSFVSPEDAADGATPAPAGAPVASFSSAPIDLGSVACGEVGSASLTVTNGGTGVLAVGASAAGPVFSVAPSSLSIAPGGSATLAITAQVPTSSPVGAPVPGALVLFTDDPSQAKAVVALSVTPEGASVVLAPRSPSSAAFPPTEEGVAAAPIAVTLMNTGNAPATVSLAAPADAEFSISSGTDGGEGLGATTLGPGATLTVSAGYTPAPGTASASSTATVTVTGTTCGTSLTTLSFSGSVGHGAVARWPTAPVDFGPAECGGPPPAYKWIVLANGGTTAATITQAILTGAPGFTSTAQGVVIPAGLTADFAVYPPAVPALSPTTALTAALTLYTDADATAHTITLTEEPEGALCAVSSAPAASTPSNTP